MICKCSKWLLLEYLGNFMELFNKSCPDHSRPPQRHQSDLVSELEGKNKSYSLEGDYGEEDEERGKSWDRYLLEEYGVELVK